MVTGAVGLIKSVNACLRPDDVQTILRSSTDPIVDAANYPNEVGTGRLNVNRAVALAQSKDYACPQGGWFDSANCYMGSAPAGTTPFVDSGNTIRLSAGPILAHSPAVGLTVETAMSCRFPKMSRPSFGAETGNVRTSRPAAGRIG